MVNQIAQTFGVEIEKTEKTPKQVSSVPATYDEFTKQLIEHRQKDYGTVRDNLHNLLKDMVNVVDDVMDEVKSNPSARMIESFSTLVKTFSEINKDLLSLTDKSSETNKVSTQVNEDSKVNNVIFVGTSDSLIEQIRKNI